MKLSDQTKINGMLKECHRDLSFIVESMQPPEPLTNKVCLLNMHLFKAIDNEVLLWLRNLEDGSVLTLASRNIFELYLILLEVNQNENSMNRFFAQLDSDRTELNFAFMNKCEAAGYTISDNDKSVLQEEINSVEFEGIETHSFRMHNLAKNHGYQKDYDFFYKLSSKLIHPSAFKVFGIDDNSPQYEVIAMVGHYFVSKATDFAVGLYNNSTKKSKTDT